MENLDTFFQELLKNSNTYLQSFWETITFEFVFKFGLVYFFLIWIALLVWVIKDISIRTDSILFQILAVFIILIGTPFGVFLYLIIRPSKTLYEKYYDEIEDNLDIFHELIEERKKELEINKRVNDKYNKLKNKSEKNIKIKNEEEDEVLEINNDQKLKEEIEKKKESSEKIDEIKKITKDNLVDKLEK